jgi:hypothetical protein
MPLEIFSASKKKGEEKNKEVVQTESDRPNVRL